MKNCFFDPFPRFAAHIQETAEKRWAWQIEVEGFPLDRGEEASFSLATTRAALVLGEYRHEWLPVEHGTEAALRPHNR